MVLDTLENLEKYISLNPLFVKVVEYLKYNDLNSHEEGKEFIDGENLFVNYCLAEGKSKENAKLETHDKMIDIQIPLSSRSLHLVLLLRFELLIQVLLIFLHSI